MNFTVSFCIFLFSFFRERITNTLAVDTELLATYVLLSRGGARLLFPTIEVIPLQKKASEERTIRGPKPEAGAAAAARLFSGSSDGVRESERQERTCERGFHISFRNRGTFLAAPFIERARWKKVRNFDHVRVVAAEKEGNIRRRKYIFPSICSSSYWFFLSDVDIFAEKKKKVLISIKWGTKNVRKMCLKKREDWRLMITSRFGVFWPKNELILPGLSSISILLWAGNQATNQTCTLYCKFIILRASWPASSDWQAKREIVEPAFAREK